MEFEAETGSGWFPGTFNKSSFFGLNFTGNSIYVSGEPIKSSSFVNPSFQFVQESFNDRNQRRLSEKFERESNSELVDFERTGLQVGIDYVFSFYLPFFIETGLFYEFREDYIRADLGTSPFLSQNNNIENFQEFSVVHLNEDYLGFHIGIKLPIYGAYISSSFDGDPDLSRGSSYYFLDLKYSSNYVFDSDLDQFNMMTTAKNSIRYANGYDSLHLQTDVRAENLIDYRHALQFGIGFLSLNSLLGFEASINYRMPLNGILEDSSWRQHMIGFSTKIYLDTFTLF